MEEEEEDKQRKAPERERERERRKKGRKKERKNRNRAVNDETVHKKEKNTPQFSVVEVFLPASLH